MASDRRSRVAVITGCSTGFGHATALRLAGRGWTVIATVRRQADGDALAAVTPPPGRLVPVLCDITQADQVAALTGAVAATASDVDLLVNNAGTAYPGPVELLALDDLRAQFEVNVIGHVGVTQALLPALKRARGTIVNVSSISGRIAMPVLGAYCASKSAIEALSDAARIELAPFGVRVVLIEPGSSPTAIWRTSDARLARMREGDYASLVIAGERLAEADMRTGFPPERFAALVERIASARRPRARYTIPRRIRAIAAARAIVPDGIWDWIVRKTLRW